MSTEDIQIGKKGKMLTGDDAGWFVLVQDDTANTGGYLILRSTDYSFASGHGSDDWVENIEQLQRFFGFTKWTVEWLE